MNGWRMGRVLGFLHNSATAGWIARDIVCMTNPPLHNAGRLIPVAAALIVAGSAHAQSTAQVISGVTIAPPTIRSGLDTIVYQRSVTRNGVDSLSGTRIVERAVVRNEAGRTLLRVVQRFPGGGGTIVDTAVAELASLRAIAHESHQPTKTMRFTFDSTAALGRVVQGDSTQLVRQQLGGPIFDSNIIEMVVAVLPLRDGFSADVPFFIYERGGRVPMKVSVKERTRATFLTGERDSWVVSIAVPGAPATVWVDAATRDVLRVRYDIVERAMSFTDERTKG